MSSIVAGAAFPTPMLLSAEQRQRLLKPKDPQALAVKEPEEKYDLYGRNARDAAFRERFTALRVEQNLQENDPRRRRSASDLTKILVTNGWNLLQRGMALDGVAVWLLRAPDADFETFYKKNRDTKAILKQLTQMAALNGIAADPLGGMPAAAAAAAEKVPIYPPDASFYAGVAAAERIHPGGVSVILTTPGQEPPADVTLRHIPTVLAQVLHPKTYEADWLRYGAKHPEKMPMIRGHLRECRHMGLIHGDFPKITAVGERTVEQALNRARTGVGGLPPDYRQRIL